MIQNLKDKIKEYIPTDHKEKKDQEGMLKYFDYFDNLLLRENECAHFTASAWIVNKERTKVIMIHHNIYNSWSWVGGHADGDADLLAVARKETREETGLMNVIPLSEDIFSLEILSVEGHMKKEAYVSSHLHLNLSFLLEADESEELMINEEENSGVKWVNIEDAPLITNEVWYQGIYRKLNDKLMGYSTKSK